MTRIYRFGARRVAITIGGGKQREPTVKEMDIWISPVLRREERSGRADAITVEELRSCLQFVVNSGATLGAVSFVRQP